LISKSNTFRRTGHDRELALRYCSKVKFVLTGLQRRCVVDISPLQVLRCSGNIGFYRKATQRCCSQVETNLTLLQYRSAAACTSETDILSLQLAAHRNAAAPEYERSFRHSKALLSKATRAIVAMHGYAFQELPTRYHPKWLKKKRTSHNSYSNYLINLGTYHFRIITYFLGIVSSVDSINLQRNCDFNVKMFLGGRPSGPG